MKVNKFLKKLSAIIVGFALVAASVGAISPNDLWGKINDYQDEACILNDYNKFIEPNLLENGFYSSNVKTATDFLSKGSSNKADEGLLKFKNYVYHRLLFAQSEILVIAQDIDNDMLQLQNDNISAILEILEKNSNDLSIKQEVDNIKPCMKNCLAISRIDLTSCSLKYVQQQQKIFYDNYLALQNHIKSALDRMKACRSNHRTSQNQSYTPKTSLHSDFAGSYSGMIHDALSHGLGCFV